MEAIIQVSDLGEKNILEEFYDLIEEQRLNSDNNFELGDFYIYLKKFDKAYQRFNISCEGQKSVIYVEKWLTHTFTIFFILFKYSGFSDRKFFFAFKRYIKWFTIVLKENQSLNNEFFFSKNISENFPSLVDSEFLRFVKKEKVNFNLMKPENFDDHYNKFFRAENQISWELGFDDSLLYFDKKSVLLVYGDNFSITEFKLSENSDKLFFKHKYYELTIDLIIKDDNSLNLIQSLNHIMTSISKIENTYLKLENIKVGSLIARLNIKIKDLFAKEEVKTLLDNALEMTTKSLSGGNVSYMETKKINADIKKINSELQLFSKQIASMPNPDQEKISISLDLERKSLENELLRQEVQKSKIENIKKLSDLAALGILSVDEIKINLNEIEFLQKKGVDMKISENDLNDLI